jgi:mono/diheme cytochrome c family protein
MPLKKKTLLISIFTLLTSIFIHSASAGDTPRQIAPRWYNQQQVKNGLPVYKKHCVACHQANAVGVKSWRYKDDNGVYPAPPLNGDAHTWHHNLDSLRNTIKNGGKPQGGTMPGFAGQLNNKQIDNVLAWVQSHWSDDIYAAWLRNSKHNKRSRH